MIVDDVDKAPSSVVSFLEMMERFGRDHPRTTLVLTANSTGGLDPGLLRPERVSEWISFEPPDVAERLELLRAFCSSAKIPPAPADLERIATESDGLTQDYLREIALSIERSTIDEVSSRIALMRKLLFLPDEDDESDDGDCPKQPTPGRRIAR